MFCYRGDDDRLDRSAVLNHLTRCAGMGMCPPAATDERPSHSDSRLHCADAVPLSRLGMGEGDGTLDQVSESSATSSPWGAATQMPLL